MTKVCPKRDFEINDYSQYNGAVDREVERIREQSYRLKISNFKAMAVAGVWASLAIAILIIAVAAAHWLLDQPAPQWSPGDESQQALRSLSQEQASSDPMVTTNFVVFDKAVTSRGETVVTGKEFTPKDLATPVHQFCYIETRDASGNPDQLTLATFGGELVLASIRDAYLLNEALGLCTFQKD